MDEKQLFRSTLEIFAVEIEKLRDENAKLRARLDEQYARSFEIRERFGDG
jgi:hypothetical protein